MGSVYESAEWRALVAAVAAAPDDDLPRLVAADFLEERGEYDRAELVRVQVELAKTPRYEHLECDVCGNVANDEGELGHGKGCYVLSEDGGGSDFAAENPDWLALRERGRKLSEIVRPALRATLPDGFDATPPDPLSVVYREHTGGYGIVRRGFVDEVRCSAAAWIAHGDDVLKHHPVRRVLLTGWPALGGGDCPLARRIEPDGVIEWEVAGRVIRRPVKSAGMTRFFADRWPGVQFETPPPVEPEVISVRGVPVVMRPDLGGPVGDPYGGYLIPPGPGRDDLIARLGGPAIDWSGMRLGPPVAPARVRVVGWNDPRVAAADMAPDPADD